MVEGSEKTQEKRAHNKAEAKEPIKESTDAPHVKTLKMKKKLKKKLAKLDIPSNPELDGTYTFKRIRGGDMPIKYVIEINQIPFDVTMFKERLDSLIDSRVVLKFGKPSQITIKNEQGDDTSLILTTYNVHFLNQKSDLLFRTQFVYNASWVVSKILKERTSYYILFEQKRIDLSRNWVSKLKDPYLLLKKNSEKELTIYDFKGNFQLQIAF